MDELIAKIQNEIEENGAISFAKFMELALYFPRKGYYEGESRIGKSGDFFTSISVGNVFGELLAFQFAEWLFAHNSRSSELKKANLQLVEAGAHDGQLAFDILNWFKKFQPEIFKQLNYCILEPSPHHIESQRAKLAEFADKTSWYESWHTFSRFTFSTSHFTIVFSNELFDAMPTHRIGWDAKSKKWFEWGVGFEANKFVWKRLANESAKISFPELMPQLLEVLPDNFTTELCPEATQWWNGAACCVENGKLVAIDYGLVTEELFVPERSAGTLRAFSRHHASLDLLANPGEQDLTAHVNFSALKASGELNGWKTDLLVSQSQFLTAIFQNTLRGANQFPEWNSDRTRQFQTLTHPEHLGRSFRVLVQSR